MQHQCAAQEQRQAHHRVRQAYVNAQLAEQWAAGQPWAELDATGVPWSAEAAATAEQDWREVTLHLLCNIVREPPLAARSHAEAHRALAQRTLKGDCASDACA